MSGARAPEQIDEAADDRGIILARAVPLGPPTDAQRELIAPHVVDPSILEERELFVWQVTASNSNLDSYFTRMHESSLRNYAEDAKLGLAFMNSHRTGGYRSIAELPLGHTFDGRYVGPSGAGPARTEETIYTFRGMAPNGAGSLTTDQLIENLRSGIARDVSITFIPGQYRCSIDGLDWLKDMACRHWPGVTYPKLDGKGNDTGETQLAFLWVHDAHQSEVSSVFDGATPGCMVTKARRMAAAGEIRADTIDLLEQRYRVKLPNPSRSFAGADIPQPAKEAEPMDLTPEQIASIRLALTTAGQAPDADIVAAVQAVADEARVSRERAAEIDRLKPFEARVAELAPLADEGRQYRADLVTRALTEGKRALGDKFAEETMRGLLETVPLETVRSMTEAWTAIGDAQFQGGRLTRDAADPTPITARTRRPAAAYS